MKVAKHVNLEPEHDVKKTITIHKIMIGVLGIREKRKITSMRLKLLTIGFCDSCRPYLRITAGTSYCKNANEKIGDKIKFIQIPEWCPLPEAEGEVILCKNKK